MNNFKQKLITFMYGRYGMDELYIGLLVLWILITLANSFVKSEVISAILTVIAYAVLIFGIYRFMSRKHDRRVRENRIFLKFWSPIKNWFTFQRDRIRDRKTARYRKCRHCRAIVKLPVKKGKHTVVCPKCRQKFDVRI